MKKILVIDDDPVLINYFQKRLAGLGYDVAVASSAEEGLGAMQKTRPDLIIADVIMPGMDGFSFLREIRTHDVLAGIPVFIVTSREELGDIFKMEGAREFFPKPVDTEALLEKVKALLG